MGLKVVFQLSIIFQKYAAFFIISFYDVFFSSEKLSANGICLFSCRYSVVASVINAFNTAFSSSPYDSILTSFSRSVPLPNG